MSPVNDEQVVAYLDSLGVPPENIFLLGVDSQSGGLIGFWHPEVGFRYLITENDQLAEACKAYLLNRGARRFATGGEAYQTANAEKWPGWDTGSNAVRARRLSSLNARST